MAKTSAKEKAAARWGVKDNQGAKTGITPVRKLSSPSAIKERELLKEVRRLIELAECGSGPVD